MLDDVIPPRRSRLSRVIGSVLSPNDQSRDLEADEDLHELGLTSLNMVNLMLAVETEYGFVIPKNELHPDNFKSLRAIDAMVSRLTPS